MTGIMKHTLKIIGLSAIGTTLFWIAVIGGFIACCGKTMNPKFTFWEETDDFGVMTIGGSQTQSIVAVVEDLGSAHTNLVAVQPPLIEHELKAGESLRLGIRTTVR
jgi:hypothetical protein